MGYAAATLASIRAHAEAAWPEECCGLVTVDAVRPARNLEAGARFEVDPATLVRAHGRILGVYHSHCGVPAVMSQADLAAARFWPDVDHVVVRVDDGVASTVRCHEADGTVRWTSA